MTLKEKTITGLFWNAADKFTSMGLEFVVGIVLARILSPKEFGLIGMIAVFIVISQMFINSGFSQALIRKNDCTQTDYSTAFFFNLAAGTLIFIVLFFSAPLISNFFEEPQLTLLVQVLGLSLIISSLTLIQRTILIQRIDFKLQTRISVIATVFSGGLAIFMALKGFGVWSLVVKTISRDGINSLLLWLWNKWKPTLEFSKKSFQDLFGFGSKLLLSGLIGTIFSNVYYIVIGKYFSAETLGFYTRAELFKNLPSQNIESIITGVGYPVLAKIQDDKQQLKLGFKRLLTTAAFIIFILMFSLAAVSEPLIITLIGEPWRQSILYLQLLCIFGMIVPLNSININMLNVIGRSDLYLKLQFVFQLLTIPVLVIGIFYGIIPMIIAMIINGMVAFCLFGKTAGEHIGYTIIEQLKDITPSLLIAGLIGSVVYFFGQLTNNYSYAVILVIQIITGVIATISICEIVKYNVYIYLKGILKEKFINNAKDKTVN